MFQIKRFLAKTIGYIFSTFVLAIIVSLIVQYFRYNQKIEPFFKMVGVLGYTIIGLFLILVIIFLFVQAIDFYKSKNTFWKNLTDEHKKIIDTYLCEIYQQKILPQFELGFDPQTTHVSLSGLLTPKAEEEKRRGIREPIKNIDQYLLSPNNKLVLVSGSPGAGKSTTLYKTFKNYKDRCSERQSTHIPIFIHANEIAKIIDNYSTYSNILDFISKIYEDNSSKNVNNFVILCQHLPLIKFLIIVDALDEFLDKSKRDLLFDSLDALIEKTQKNNTRWILSCREDEYRAYSKNLKVSNVLLKPMDLKQRKQFEEKRINTISGLSQEEKVQIRRWLKALDNAEKKDETFLSNPYYLALWLWQVSYEKDFNTEISSIEELHETELKREIVKGKGWNPASRSDMNKIDQRFLKNTKTILSVISYYFVETSLTSLSLTKQARKYVELADSKLFLYLSEPIINELVSNNQDEITQRRIDEYLPGFANIKSHKTEDILFVEFLQKLKQFIHSLKASEHQRQRFLIVFSSILEQASKNRLINIDKNLKLSGFVNQRAGDYLVAYFLKESGLKTLQKGKINPWWSRPIAIALAISERPEQILQSIGQPQDFVIESAIIDGLTLIPVNNKPRLNTSITEFSRYFLNEERLFGEDRDPCDPLRALRGIYRLCTNGYSDSIQISDTLLRKLLKHGDVSIAEAATISLLLYACETQNNTKTLTIFFQHFLKKAVFFELLADKAFQGYITTIRDARRK